MRTVMVAEEGSGLWGAQKYILRLAPLLKDRGFEMVLVAPKGSEVIQAWVSEGGRVVEVEPRPVMPEWSSWREIRPMQTLKIASGLVRRSWQFSRLAKSEDYTVLIGNSSGTHGTIALAGVISRTPTTVILHEQVFGIMMWARKVAALLASRVVAVSSVLSKDLGSTRSKKVITVLNGVDSEVFTPGICDVDMKSELCADVDSPLVAFVGRLDEMKQLDHLLMAVENLSGPLASTQVVAVGGPSTDPEYATHLKDLGEQLLGERVRFVGIRDDVRSVYRCADVVVFPGRVEGLSLGLLEAMSSGCPVVTYRAAGVDDVLVDGESGVIVAMGDWRALSTAIAGVLSNPDKSRKMVQNAREVIVTRQSLDSQADELVRVLEELN